MHLPGQITIQFIGGPACGNTVTCKTKEVLQTYRVPVPHGRPVDINDTRPEPSCEEAVYELARARPGGYGPAVYVYVYDKLGAL